MAKCPICKRDVDKPEKTWKYGVFDVKAYMCPNCQTRFREYFARDKLSFMLKLEKGKGFTKV